MSGYVLKEGTYSVRLGSFLFFCFCIKFDKKVKYQWPSEGRTWTVFSLRNSPWLYSTLVGFVFYVHTIWYLKPPLSVNTATRQDITQRMDSEMKWHPLSIRRKIISNRVLLLANPYTSHCMDGEMIYERFLSTQHAARYYKPRSLSPRDTTHVWTVKWDDNSLFIRCNHGVTTNSMV